MADHLCRRSFLRRSKSDLALNSGSASAELAGRRVYLLDFFDVDKLNGLAAAILKARCYELVPGSRLDRRLAGQLSRDLPPPRAREDRGHEQRPLRHAARETLGVSLRLHDLRTAFASRLAANGTDVATAQALLRHAKPSTTLDIYTRIRGDAAAKLERMRAALEG